MSEEKKLRSQPCEVVTMLVDFMNKVFQKYNSDF